MDATEQSPQWSQRLMAIAWPGFLVACLLEVLVFALVDPQDVRWLGQQISSSRETVYTLTFFVFWLMAMLSSALTYLLSARLSGRPWG
jgi:hypothetical protein